MRFAFAALMRVAATSATAPVTTAAREEYAYTSLRVLVHTGRVLRAHRGENVKFPTIDGVKWL
jgi:hypothetical protein